MHSMAAEKKPISKLRRLMSYVHEEVLERTHSSLHPALTVELAYGRLVLNGSKVNHAWGPLHDIFVQAFELVAPDFRNMAQIGIIGFGAGDVAAQVRERGFTGMIYGVEPDSEVRRLFEKYFRNAGMEPFTLIGTDNPDNPEFPAGLDMLITDAFVEDQVPLPCRDITFYKAIAARLLPGGIFVQNFMTGTPERMEEFTQARLFAETSLQSVRYWKIDQNHILTGHA